MRNMENKTFSITYTGRGEIGGTIKDVPEETFNDLDKLKELVRKEIKAQFPDVSAEELLYEKIDLENAPENFQAGVPLDIF